MVLWEFVAVASCDYVFAVDKPVGRLADTLLHHYHSLELDHPRSVCRGVKE